MASPDFIWKNQKTNKSLTSLSKEKSFSETNTRVAPTNTSSVFRQKVTTSVGYVQGTPKSHQCPQSPTTYLQGFYKSAHSHTHTHTHTHTLVSAVGLPFYSWLRMLIGQLQPEGANKQPDQELTGGKLSGWSPENKGREGEKENRKENTTHKTWALPGMQQEA